MKFSIENLKYMTDRPDSLFEPLLARVAMLVCIIPTLLFRMNRKEKKRITSRISDENGGTKNENIERVRARHLTLTEIFIIKIRYFHAQPITHNPVFNRILYNCFSPSLPSLTFNIPLQRKKNCSFFSYE